MGENKKNVEQEIEMEKDVDIEDISKKLTDLESEIKGLKPKRKPFDVVMFSFLVVVFILTCVSIIAISKVSDISSNNINYTVNIDKSLFSEESPELLIDVDKAKMLIENALTESTATYILENTKYAIDRVYVSVAVTAIFFTIIVVIVSLFQFMKNKEYERQYEKYADEIKSMQDNLTEHHKRIDDASADMQRKSKELSEEREKSESTLKDINDKLQDSLKLSLTNIEYNEGTRLFNNKEYTESLNQFKKLIEFFDKKTDSIDTKDISSKIKIDTYYKMGKCYSENKEYEKALECYDDIVKMHEYEDNAYLLRGNTCFELEKYDEAIVNFDSAININKKNAHAYAGRGKTKSRIGEDPFLDFNEAIELDPTEVKFYDLRGKEFFDKSDYENAITDFSRGVELLLPTDLVQKIDTLEIEDLKLNIANDSDTTIENKNKISLLYLNRGRCYFNLKTIDKAIQDFSRGILFDSTNSNLYINRAVCYFQTPLFEEAIADLDKSIELDPLYVDLYTFRGLAYVDLGKPDYEQAIANYDKSIELDPLNVGLFIRRGRAYFELKNYEQAIVNYDKGIELDPSDEELYTLKGDAYVGLKDYKKAIENYDEGLYLDPNNTDLYKERGRAYFELEDYEQAIASYDEGLELYSDYPELYKLKGNAYGKLKDYYKAIENADKGIEIDPDDAELYELKGNAYSMLKDYEKAIENCEKGLELNSDNTNLYKIRGSSYANLEKYEKAVEDFDRAIIFSSGETELYYQRAKSNYKLGIENNNVNNLKLALEDYKSSLSLLTDIEDKDYDEDKRDLVEKITNCQGKIESFNNSKN